jgi:hypothetical protein
LLICSAVEADSSPRDTVNVTMSPRLTGGMPIGLRSVDVLPSPNPQRQAVGDPVDRSRKSTAVAGQLVTFTSSVSTS